MAEARVIWRPQPKQRAFMARPEYEALYGGAAGGGKSRRAAVQRRCGRCTLRTIGALILRKTYPELAANWWTEAGNCTRQRFPEAKYVGTRACAGCFRAARKFTSAACSTQSDRRKYQGKRYDFIAFDELTHFTWEEYSYMFSRNRPSGPGTRVYIRATTNPGGIGHGWVKERFITRRAAADADCGGGGGAGAARALGSCERSTESLCRPRYLTIRSYCGTRRSIWQTWRCCRRTSGWRCSTAAGTALTGRCSGNGGNDPAHYADQRWTHVIDPFRIPEALANLSRV